MARCVIADRRGMKAGVGDIPVGEGKPVVNQHKQRYCPHQSLFFHDVAQEQLRTTVSALGNANGRKSCPC
jgi:hypothetical protein